MHLLNKESSIKNLFSGTSLQLYVTCFWTLLLFIVNVLHVCLCVHNSKMSFVFLSSVDECVFLFDYKKKFNCAAILLYFVQPKKIVSCVVWITVDSHYLEVHGTLLSTSRCPYLDISDLQNWGKNNQQPHFTYVILTPEVRDILKISAGLGGSVGCAVRLETRRSRVQPPPRSATFFHGDRSWNTFYGHSLPSADSRRVVVSFWQKNVQILVIRLED